jgi:hypothetical protein
MVKKFQKNLKLKTCNIFNINLFLIVLILINILYFIKKIIKNNIFMYSIINNFILNIILNKNNN